MEHKSEETEEKIHYEPQHKARQRKATVIDNDQLSLIWEDIKNLQSDITFVQKQILRVSQLKDRVQQIDTELENARKCEEEKQQEADKQKETDQLKIFLTADKYRVRLIEYYDLFKNEGIEDMDTLKEMTAKLSMFGYFCIFEDTFLGEFA